MQNQVIPFPKMHPECQLRVIRQQREPLLSEADILINKALDKGSDVSALRTYRQALRDVTKQDPANVVWPQKPE